MKLDRLIAKGKNTQVYQDGDNAIKVFNKEYSKVDVLTEALMTAQVENIGLNIPKVREVFVVNGGWAITMEYIEGKTLGQLMSEFPEKMDEYLDLLVDLQIEVHSKKNYILKKLKDKLWERINSISDLDSSKKYELLSLLDGTPNHDKVCHGDFTPNNIIISDKDGKPYIIDWNHATVGNASADVARSYLWMSLYQKDISEEYLEKFCKKSKTDKSYVQKWIPIVAAARLEKNIPEEKPLIMKWIDIMDYE